MKKALYTKTRMYLPALSLTGSPIKQNPRGTSGLLQMFVSVETWSWRSSLDGGIDEEEVRTFGHNNRGESTHHCSKRP